MSKAEEEQRKLFANLLNNMANGCFVVGILAPIVAVLYRRDSDPSVSESSIEIAVCVLIVAMAGLHLAAQAVIGGLEDD